MRYINKLTIIIAGLLAFTFSSCDDFFETNPDNIINAGDYINKDDEMYKGFLGIITKMQQAGDHAIFLTDTRGEFLETTGNAPIQLQNINNYESTIGNKYADPTCYYSIIIACNDYIEKMTDYRIKKGTSMDDRTAIDFDALISNTLRLKVWSYLTLGRIYGKAVWFDDALEELKDLNDTNVFTHLNNMKDVAEKCLYLLDNGIMINGNTISADLQMNWGAWLDSETENYDDYKHWDYIVPTWLILKCELMAWRGTTDDYTWIRDNILEYLYSLHTDATITNGGYMYACNIPLTGMYSDMFFNKSNGYVGNQFQLICGIMYDYKNKQRNRLVEYLCPSYPGDSYYLRPSYYARSRYAEQDVRGFTQRLTMNTINGDTCLTKYYYHRGEYLNTNIFEINPTIILYRGHDFHFLLAEAENHLGNWRQAESILNRGLNNEFPGKVIPDDWHYGYTSWFGGNGGYGDVGIVGCVRGADNLLPKPTEQGYSLTEEQRIRLYDEALVDEYLREFTGEGKSYSYMVRMAEKYNDPSIISSRVCNKYSGGMRDKVKAQIESGNYWVEWNLDIKN